MSKTTGDEGGSILKRVWENVLNVFYPKRCVICDQILEKKENFLCSYCVSVPKYIGENYCMKCGKVVKDGEEYCFDCKEKETTFLCGRSVFVYDKNMKRSISRFKYHGRQEYAEYYIQEMYRIMGGWIRQVQPDALIPVPIHKERFRIRGFNQSELLAKGLGELCEVPVITDFLVRIKNTLPQKELSDKERLQNLQQAFATTDTKGKLYKIPKCVIIIDDIYTTGSTLEACSRILKQKGIERTYCLCVCIGHGF